MKACIRATALALLAVLVTASGAAAAAKTFTIAPFAVNGAPTYAYLEQSIPQMFASRLFWQGHFEPAPKTGTTKKLNPADEAEAEKARAAAGADYVIWGSVTVVGNNSSIDVRVRDKDGKSWPMARESNINRLIPDLRQVSDAISTEVFQRPSSSSASRAAVQQRPEPVNQMNPGLVRNETSGAEVYINPQFRYSGKSDDDSRLRSQVLPFSSVGMEICDATGDGMKEVFLLGDNALHAYRFEGDDRLVLLGTHKFPSTHQGLSIRSLDLDFSGRNKLVVNTKTGDEELVSYVFSFDGQNFKQEAKGLNIYLNVVILPPMYKPQLLAQRTNPPHLFLPGVAEASIRNGEVVMGAKLALPKDFNVFNFAYIPAGNDRRDGMKMVMLDQEEKLRLYSEQGARMFASQESYSGSPQGLFVDISLPGFGKSRDGMGNMYYIPMRMLAVDLDRDGNSEVIVNKPITTAGEFFHNYRSFPQSEIHSLQWDGLGMALVWKTRRIKGSVCDYTIADVNNDGVPDLVVCVNTHPGALGVAARKSMVIAYPLDLSKADPGTRPTFME